MKVLIIADNLGNNAPGVVYKNLLKGLSPKLEFDLITSTMDYKEESKRKLFYCKQNRISSWRIRTFLFCLFGYYHTQNSWARKVQKFVENGCYDTIISFVSSTFYASVTAADMYASKHKVNHICYCVDAVPAPFPWEKDGWYSRAMKRLVRKRMQNVDILCMTNQEMLDYEQKIIGKVFKKTIVLPNPPMFDHLVELPINTITPSFAYAGQIYGARNPDALIDGFGMFATNHPDSKLYFVGTKSLKQKLVERECPFMDNIIFLDYTKELLSIYNKCIGLIDVNSNFDNDVFLSSKLLSYLPYNRLIIVESGKNSPARSLFGGSKTIIHVDHNPTSYYDAFEYCLSHYDNTNFMERENYLSSMSINAVSDILISNCNEI